MKILSLLFFLPILLFSDIKSSGNSVIGMVGGKAISRDGEKYDGSYYIYNIQFKQ